MKLRLAILFLRYDNGKYPGAFESVKKYLENVSAEKVYFIIDNLNEGSYVNKNEENEYLVGGDNSDWEFSGWQRGVQVLNQLNIKYDVILFINDAFLAYGWSILQNPRLDEIISKIMVCKALVGQLDTKGTKLESVGNDVSEWICTNCFFVAYDLLQIIESVVSVHYSEMDSFIDSEYYDDVPLFKLDAPLSNAYKSMIIQWLTEEWHSKFKINNKTWAFYRHKVCAILNEGLLTAKFKKRGLKALSYKNLIS